MSRKPLPLIIIALSGIITGILIAGMIYTFTGFSIFGSYQRKTVAIDEAESANMTMLAYRVLEYLKDDDFTALSYVVHPDYGLVFSPNATINLSTDRRFSVEQTAALGNDNYSYVWGVYNESGEPIELTPAEYLDKFVSAADFYNAPVIGINHIIRSGNALENITEVFPEVQFIDFHIPGSEAADDLDWRSLRLGFEAYNGYFRLIAIVYSTWAA